VVPLTGRQTKKCPDLGEVSGRELKLGDETLSGLSGYSRRTIIKGSHYGI
jgi:hypothetical protein